MNKSITELLHAWHLGDRASLDAAMPMIYEALRRTAAQRLRGERSQTLNPTALVHEALLRILGADTDFASRSHFLAVASLHMRGILVDQARARNARKRGNGAIQVTSSALEEAGEEDGFDLLALDQALAALANHDERAARVMQMSCFAGMEHEEIATATGVSVPTVVRDLRFARAWIHRALEHRA
ncbi:MAG TPA: ECF-type sigma factor [Dokdonella sp.]|nr:ECF-type sigma factor [Dokdonella sp.]